jgi:hypothetical protein
MVINMWEFILDNPPDIVYMSNDSTALMRSRTFPIVQ